MRFVSRDELNWDGLDGDSVGVMTVTRDELAMMFNLVAQVRAAIDDWELDTLVGMTPEEADVLRQGLNEALDATRRPQT